MAFSLEEIDHATEYALGQLGYASLKEVQKEALTAFVLDMTTPQPLHWYLIDKETRRRRQVKTRARYAFTSPSGLIENSGRG